MKNMNKVVIKEFDRTLLGVDIMLYTIIAVVGYIILEFTTIEALKVIDYVPPMFYMFAFFSLVAYFVNRRPNNYEFLFFGLINVIVGSFVLVNNHYPESGFILGNAVLIYSIANVLNKGYYTKQLTKVKDINLYPKLAITILLGLLGVLIICNLYKNDIFQSLILGYYFMTFGLISLLEPLLMIIMRNPKLETYLVNLLEDEEEQKITEKVKMKEVKTKKPQIKKVDKDDEKDVSEVTKKDKVKKDTKNKENKTNK